MFRFKPTFIDESDDEEGNGVAGLSYEERVVAHAEQVLRTQRCMGVDEVARGCLYGDVVCAAVVLPQDTSCFHADPRWALIKDSKKLTEKRRKEAAEYVRSIAVVWGIGSATAQEIDATNILKATMVAMHRAIDDAVAKVAATGETPMDALLIDGQFFTPYGSVSHVCIPKGDAKFKCIAAASILAKVHHDEVLLERLQREPELNKYDLAKNKGYGTQKHLAALRTHGATNDHRRSFRGVL